MDCVDFVGLPGLMLRTEGKREIAVALIDGPIALDHPDLADSIIIHVSGSARTCSSVSSVACRHGTFVAGILFAKRGAAAPAICPGCTLIMRPIFFENTKDNSATPSATPEELAAAIADVIEAGANVINLSAAMTQTSLRGERQLEQALDYAADRGVLVVAAAGNQGTLGSSAITRHSWVIPVIACDTHGRPTSESNLGSSIGRRGLSAPGENIASLGTGGVPETFRGTSAATPFVTGTIALLWSEFPGASAGRIKSTLLRAAGPSRRSIIPPLLNAGAAHAAMGIQ